MFSITEVMAITIKEGVSIEQARLKQAGAIAMAEKTPGLQAIKCGFAVSDPRKSYWFLSIHPNTLNNPLSVSDFINTAWNSHAHLQSYTQSPSYPEFAAVLQEYSTFGGRLIFSLSPFCNPQTNSTAEMFARSTVIEFCPIELKLDADVEAFLKGLHELDELSTKFKEEGFNGNFQGPIVQDEREGRLFAMIGGWEKREQREVYERRIDQERKEEGRRGVLGMAKWWDHVVVEV